MARVRIISLPKAKSGMEVRNSGSGMNYHTMPWSNSDNSFYQSDIEVNKTLKESDDDGEPNVEVEHGETIFTDKVGDGIPQLYTAKGAMHYNGGIELNLPEDSFIFSRDKKMKIGGPILESFGKHKDTKKKFTPADLSMKYQINDFRKVLADKNSDKLQRETAEAMIANYSIKLSKLGLVQESIKGFPDGIPSIAMPYLQMMQIDPASFTANSQQGPPQMKYGGHLPNSRYGGYLPKAQEGTGDVPEEDNIGRYLGYLGSVLGAFDKGANYLKQYPGYWGSGLAPFANPQYEDYSETLDRLNDPYRVERAAGQEYVPSYQHIKGVPYQKDPNKYIGTSIPIPDLKHMPKGKAFVQDVWSSPTTYLGGLGAYTRTYQAAKLAKPAVVAGAKLIKPAVVAGAKYLKKQTSKAIQALKEVPLVKGIDISTAVLSKYDFDDQKSNNMTAGERAAAAQYNPYQPSYPIVPDATNVDTTRYEHLIPDTTGVTPTVPDTIRGISAADMRKKMGLPPIKKLGGGLPQAKKGVSMDNSGNYWFEDDAGNIYPSNKQDYDDYLTLYPVTQQQGQAPGVTSSTKEPIKTYNPYGILGKEGVRNLLTEEQQPYIREEDVHGYQPPVGTTGTYGKGVTVADFIKRNPKWNKEHPNFNPKLNTSQFQKEYNVFVRKVAYDNAIAAKYPEKDANDMADAWVRTQGFKPGKKVKGDPRYMDDDFGEFTSSRFEPSWRAYAAPGIKEGPKPTTTTNTDTDIAKYNLPPPEIWRQHKMQGMGAYGELMGINKYPPYQATPSYVPGDAVYHDDARDLANMAERINIGTQGAAMYSGPQGYAATAAALHGQGAVEAANIMGTTDDKNIAIANQLNRENTSIFNRASERRAQDATTLFDKQTIANQQYDNERRMASRNLLNIAVAADTARANTYNLNTLNPQYAISARNAGIAYNPQGSNRAFNRQQQSNNEYISQMKAINESGLPESDKEIMKQGMYRRGNQSQNQNQYPDQYQYPTFGEV